MLTRLSAARLVLCTALLVACKSAGSAPAADPERAVARVLDDWHQAASVADGARYFGHMAEDAVYLGTDASERWTLPEFRSFCEPYFSKGVGWTYEPRERHVS